MKINLNDNVGDFAVGMDLFATTFAVFFVLMSIGLVNKNLSYPADIKVKVSFVIQDTKPAGLPFHMQIGEKEICNASGCKKGICEILGDEFQQPWVIVCDSTSPAIKTKLLSFGNQDYKKAEISIVKITPNEMCYSSIEWTEIRGVNHGKEVKFKNCN